MTTSQPKRIICPGLLLYEYLDDDKRYELVGVIDTSLDGEISIEDEFIKSGNVIFPAVEVKENGR